MAKISRVGSNTANSNTITIPAHQAGDLIIISAVRASNTAPSLPSDWTSIQSAGANTLSMRTGYRIATDGSTTSGTWTNAAGLICLVYRPIGGELSIGASATANGNSQTYQRYPALTLGDKEGETTVLYVGVRANSSGTTTAPTGYTNITSRGSSSPYSMAHDRIEVTTNPTQTDVTGLTSGAYRTHGIEIDFKADPVPSNIIVGATYKQNNLFNTLNFDSGTGTNRVLVAFVGIAWADSNSITSVSYGGVAMTPMGATQNDEWGWSSVKGFYLVNPKTGANDFEVVTSDNSVANMTAIVLNGVDTSNPIGTVNSAKGSSATASVSLAQSGAGNLLVAGVSNSADAGTITGSGGSTVQIMNDTGAYFLMATATKPTTGTGNLAIATSNTDDGWAIQGAEFRAVAESVKGIKVWNGTAWVMKPVKVWNGTAWVMKPVKVWNGTAWV